VTEPSRAVFLSYASQDSEAAQKICDALRAAGIEVWFDRSELRGGDAWDQKIRRQIKTCALFIPVISRNAHARIEGYFRLEWKLAVDRSHLIAPDQAFLVPVVIDDTPQDDERIPDRFRELQWTRLPGGQVTAAFVEHVHRLLSTESLHAPIVASPPAAAPSATAPKFPGSANAPERWKPAMLVISTLLAVALGCAIVDKLWLSKRNASSTVDATTSARSHSLAVPEKSIAVLPFVDMSEKHDQEYFADGMAEEIIDLLAKVPDLRVPARTSSFYFKGKSTKVPDIASELGVANVLEGSIRRSGNQIRVTAQLVRAGNGYHLWSQTYDRDLRDVFKVQDDIANAVVQALQITLMGGPLTRQKGGTQNLEAYELYLRAVSAELQNTKFSLDSGRGYLEQAIKLDPNFGLAWAWMALNSMELADSAYVLPAEGYPRARQQAQHALELSPNLAMAHCVLQWVYRIYDWDWVASESEGRLALSIDPTNSRALMMAGLLSSTLGHGDDAERQIGAALASDPLNTYARFNLGFVQYSAGRFASADASYRNLINLAPDFQWTHMYLGTTLLAEGKPEEALAMVRLEVDEEDRLDFLPIMLQASGHKAEADEALNALATKFSATSAYFVALNYAYRNDRDLALQWLDRAYKQKDASLVEIAGEPLFKNLANDPRYKAFRRKMNLPE
jgi:TolB-like protein